MDFKWPCQYCKLKFINIEYSVQHELYLCDKNPKFKYTTKLETNYLKKKHTINNKCQELNQTNL